MKFYEQLKAQPWWPFFSTIAIVIFIWRLYKMITKAADNGANVFNKSRDAQLLMNETPNYTTAQAIQRIDELKQIAQNASDAIWGFYWIFGQSWLGYGYNYVEDETSFIDALNQCNTAKEANLISDYYKQYNQTWTQSKGQSIKADFEKYLSKSEQNRVKSIIKNNLK